MERCFVGWLFFVFAFFVASSALISLSGNTAALAVGVIITVGLSRCEEFWFFFKLVRHDFCFGCNGSMSNKSKSKCVIWRHFAEER